MSTFKLASPRNPTSLMVAVMERKIELVRIFLGNGHNPNVVVDASGATALHYAAANGVDEAVRLLLRFGADTTLKLASGETAEDLARINQHEQAAQLFDMVHSAYTPSFFKSTYYKPAQTTTLLCAAEPDETYNAITPHKPTSAA